MANLLEVRDLSVNYGEIRALKDVSLSVAGAEIVALLGPNGAGKSTTIKAIMGFVKPVAGTIVVNDVDLARHRTHEIARHGVALVPDGRRIFKRMTVRENLEVGGVTRTAAEVRASMEEVYELFPRLRERRRQLAGTLSGGEQQMLAIGRALMARPSFLLMDEPSLGLAPLIVEQVFETIGRIRRELGIGGILVEQNVEVALSVADRGYVLSRGSLVTSGDAAALRGSPHLHQAYLGM